MNIIKILTFVLDVSLYRAQGTDFAHDFAHDFCMFYYFAIQKTECTK